MRDSNSEAPINSPPKELPGESLVESLRNIPRVITFVVLLAFFSSFLYFQHFHEFYTPDSPTYLAPAANLIAGKGFTGSTGYPETVRTPGYPLLVIPFLWTHLNLKYLILFQHLVRLLIVLATTAFAYQISGSRRLALTTGILLSIDLPLLEATNVIMTEILFTALLSIVLWLLSIESMQTETPGLVCLLCGLLSGASVLVRPVGVFFLGPAVLYLSLSRRTFRMRTALFLTLSFTCLPLGWAARNYWRTGYFTVSSISGINMLLYRAAGALAINDGGDFHANFEKRQQELAVLACEDLSQLYRRNCAELPIPLKAVYYSRLGRTILSQHPIAYTKLALRSSAVMMLDGGPSSLAAITGINPHVAIRLLLIYTFPSLCLAIVGLFRFWREDRNFFYLVFLTVSYFVVISAGAESNSRFRVPIMPFYALLIAAGVDFILYRCHKHTA